MKGCPFCSMRSHASHIDCDTCKHTLVASTHNFFCSPSFLEQNTVLLCCAMVMTTTALCRNATVEAGPHVLPRAVQQMWDQVAEGKKHTQPSGLLCLGEHLLALASWTSRSWSRASTGLVGLTNSGTALLVSQAALALLCTFVTLHAVDPAGVCYVCLAGSHCYACC